MLRPADINEDNFDPATIGLENNPGIVRYYPHTHHHENYDYRHDFHVILIMMIIISTFLLF